MCIRDSNSSIALGIGNAVGPHMTGIGADLISNSKFQVTVGSANDSSIRVSNRDDIWNPEDPIFVVGNGESKTERSNAVVVRKNGNTEIYGKLRIYKPSSLLPMGPYALDGAEAASLPVSDGEVESGAAAGTDESSDQ